MLLYSMNQLIGTTIRYARGVEDSEGDVELVFDFEVRAGSFCSCHSNTMSVAGPSGIANIMSVAGLSTP